MFFFELVFQEVIDQGGEPIKDTEYTQNGRVTEFKYGKELSKGIKKEGGTIVWKIFFFFTNKRF